MKTARFTFFNEVIDSAPSSSLYLEETCVDNFDTLRYRPNAHEF